MLRLILLSIISLFIISCSSIPPRPKANAYLASQGNVDYVKSGFNHVRFGMTPGEVIDRVGHPFDVFPWYEPLGKFHRGEKLGKVYIYWMKVDSYNAYSSPKEDRWLEFHYDKNSKLKSVKGNLHGKYFDSKQNININMQELARP